MATRSAIERLSQRIDAVIVRRRPVFCISDLSDEALERAIARLRVDMAARGEVPRTITDEDLRNSPARFMTDAELIGILVDCGVLTADDFSTEKRTYRE